jgi:AcrR family transcriptional regulator
VGSKERRERERQDVRQKILEAAREILLSSGVEGMSMRKVAERIEYSPTTIYLHFTDKTALLEELLHSDFQALGAQFQRIARVGDPVERLRQAGHAYIQFGLGHPNHYRTMFSVPGAKKSSDNPDRGNPNRDGYAFLRGLVGEAMAAGRVRGNLRDAELVAQTLWAGVHGVVSLLLARGEDTWIDWRSRKAIAELMLDTLMDGICVPAPAPSDRASSAAAPAPPSTATDGRRAPPVRPAGRQTPARKARRST